MGMTISEKILAAHAGKDEVKPGEFILARVDLAFANDITAPLAIEKLKQWGIKKVFDKEKIVFIPDHFTPNRDVKAAHQCLLMRKFALEYGIKNYFEVGVCGIEHVFLPEQGFIVPGDLVIGADSHTCTHGALGAFACGVGSTDFAAAMATGEIWLKVPSSIKLVYKGELPFWTTGKDLILYTIGDIGVDGASYMAMEFTGPVISKLSISERLTMCNMAVEAGAKNGIIAPDEVTLNYLKKRVKKPYKLYKSDPEATFVDVREYDVEEIEPQVACPPLPSNTRSVSEVEDVKIDQVVIGSCTNGHLEDLKLAATVLQGKKIHPEVRTIIIPATPRIYLQALKQGIIETFIEAGAVVGPPTCGPCLGGHMGVLAEGERAIATTNRNFIGRMGHPKSEVYLANPAVAAASAVKGKITHPRQIIKQELLRNPTPGH
ncbi:3-isopropylmalate dehydratase large subunit [Candidatus Aerophobetes bacterium]|uniref:3-isopropylmalate dehydratase large subunit n=1 Tax=Aerophobetes bacterium TaxID=2030807 RepID=A0A662D922_UNCAE|nr:MAG: 3-isopropylmalate dehydratase large subunit [Candidatus Aerophobetes bacterium]